MYPEIAFRSLKEAGDFSASIIFSVMCVPVVTLLFALFVCLLLVLSFLGWAMNIIEKRSPPSLKKK